MAGNDESKDESSERHEGWLCIDVHVFPERTEDSSDTLSVTDTFFNADAQDDGLECERLLPNNISG